MDSNVAPPVDQVTPPSADDCSSIIGSNEALRGFVSRNPTAFGWGLILAMTVFILMLIFWLMGYIHFGTVTVSKYSSTFVSPMAVASRPTSILGQSRFGNNPNWRMGGVNSGYGSTVDRPGINDSLGFGVNSVSGFDPRRSTMEPRRAHLAPGPPQHQHVHHLQPQPQPQPQPRPQPQPQREGFTNQECAAKWDPMASEEAKVLSNVGSYRQGSAGMGEFIRQVNDNTTLTDAQLEAIMQGGEPFSVSPLGTSDWDAISASQRATTINPAGRGFR